MRKQMNGSFLKSVKSKRSEPKSETKKKKKKKKWPGHARAKMLYFVSGRARAEIFIFTSVWVAAMGVGSEKSGPVLTSNTDV